MAKRLDDEEEDNLPVERKRRRPRKKPVSDDEDDSGGPPGRRGASEDTEEEEENSLSTGNVLLDILLDFRDDCIEWAGKNRVQAILLGIGFFLLSGIVFGLTIRYIIRYVNRPTLAQAFTAYDYGSYGEAKLLAEEVLRHADETDLTTRSGALYVLGASTCAIAEIAWNTNRKPYYLAASNYLGESERLGFPEQRRAEGFFLLGKSLYLSGELARARQPLHDALEKGADNTKMIFWYLANSYFLDASPNLVEALRFIRLFRRNPTVTEDERYEADLLEAMILIQYGDIDAAEKSFLKVPLFERFETMRTFVSGQIAFFRARELRRKAIELENERSPTASDRGLIAPIPVEPSAVPSTEETPPEAPSPGVLPQTPPSEPASPFDNPETEKLLPASEPAETSAWPVFPTPPSEPSPPEISDSSELGPWPIVSPAPVPETEQENTPLFRRMAWLTEQAERAVADEAATASNTVSEQSGTMSPNEPVDPDAVIVLPTETPKAPTPAPLELPDTETLSGVVTDPRLSEAKLLRQQADEQYRKAIEAFRQVRRRDSFIPRWIRTAELLEGIGLEETGKLEEARMTYLNLNEAYPSTSEAAAANFLWAELERESGRPETALAGYARAFETIRDEPNYACPWLPREAILERCETILRNNLAVKEYKQALALLHLLRGVMPEADRQRHRGDVYESWAGDLRSRALQTLGPEGEKLEKESKEKYRSAGETFEEYARYRYGESDYDRQLFRGAENYRLGGDYRRAIPIYQRFLHLNWRDRQVETLFNLGEMYIHLDGLEEAVEYLNQALVDYPNSSLVPRIRIALSRAYYEKKDWKKAEELLQLNLIGEYAPASSIYRDSMFALGKLFYEQGKLEEAIPYLEDAVKIHPDAIQAADAHYCLAQAYLHRADKISASLAESPIDDIRRRLDGAMNDDRQRALVHIRKAEELLVKRQLAIGLTESEELMLRNALFEAGSILMKLGRYGEAIPTFDIAATRYQNRPEALDALMQIAVSYRHLGRPEEALPILNRAEVLLNQFEKSGMIPPDRDWASRIQVQKEIILTRGGEE